MQLNRYVAHLLLSDLKQWINRLHVQGYSWVSRGVVRLPAVGPFRLLPLLQRLATSISHLRLTCRTQVIDSLWEKVILLRPSRTVP